jgi:hypothetical protein
MLSDAVQGFFVVNGDLQVIREIGALDVEAG